MVQIIVNVEQGEYSYGAFCDELPGCVAVATSRPEIEQKMKTAIAEHLHLTKKKGEEVPDLFDGPYDLRFVYH